MQLVLPLKAVEAVPAITGYSNDFEARDDAGWFTRVTAHRRPLPKIRQDDSVSVKSSLIEILRTGVILTNHAR